MLFRYKIRLGIEIIKSYLWCKVFGGFHYNKKYLQGRWFDNFFSEGWRWALADYKGNRFLNVNLSVPWPVSSRIIVINAENISFHPDDINNFQGFGNYFQAIEEIVIGKGTYIACNVAIITANHNFSKLEEHFKGQPVILGKECWIGFNSVILPGVVLGDRTIVGAGSIVTKSFPEGHCIIAGNPAKVIRIME